MSAPAAPTRPSVVARGVVAWAAVADLLVVLVFAALGLASHDGAVDAAALVRVAWPFAVALAAGWALARAWRRPLALVRTGLVLWAATAVVGLGLRVLTGGGAAPAFVVVTAVVLLVLLVGWRLAATLVVRRRQPAGSS
ncbi:DUF3054 domain-containing protein [Microbacterium sp. NPDC055683]